MNLTEPEGFKDAIMRGQKITPTELDEFIAANQKEGQLHDYKDGKLTHATTKAEREAGLRTIKEWVTGFANAEGGVLLIGPEDAAPHAIAGCKKIGTEDPADWAQKALGEVTGMFSPAPRFQIVEHPPEGNVLLIATERAPQLIPVIESRKWTYHLRIHASTVEVPAYLISDLLLGRRNRAALELGVVSCDWKDEESKLALNVRRLVLTLGVQNRSIVRGEKVQVGVVGWTLREAIRNDHVLTFVDLRKPDIDVRGFGEWSPSLLVQRTGSDRAIPAFEHLDISEWSSTLWTPCFHPFHEKERGPLLTFAQLATFVASESSPPVWFQITFVISRGPQGEDWVRLTTSCVRMPAGERPVVTYMLSHAAKAAYEVAKTRMVFSTPG